MLYSKSPFQWWVLLRKGRLNSHYKEGLKLNIKNTLQIALKKRTCASDDAQGIKPADNCMFKANNKNTRTWCKICSKLTIKIRQRRRSGIFTVNFEHILHLVLVFLLLTLSR